MIFNKYRIGFLAFPIFCLFGCNPMPYSGPVFQDEWLTKFEDRSDQDREGALTVLPTAVSQHFDRANAKLVVRSFIALDPGQVTYYAPKAKHSNRETSYLVRWASPGSRFLMPKAIYKGGVLWLSAGVLTHRNTLPTVHTPILIQLKEPLQKVVIQLSAAE